MFKALKFISFNPPPNTTGSKWGRVSSLNRYNLLHTTENPPSRRGCMVFLWTLCLMFLPAIEHDFCLNPTVTRSLSPFITPNVLASPFFISKSTITAASLLPFLFFLSSAAGAEGKPVTDRFSSSFSSLVLNFGQRRDCVWLNEFEMFTAVVGHRLDCADLVAAQAVVQIQSYVYLHSYKFLNVEEPPVIILSLITLWQLNNCIVLPTGSAAWLVNYYSIALRNKLMMMRVHHHHQLVLCQLRTRCARCIYIWSSRPRHIWPMKWRFSCV